MIRRLSIFAIALFALATASFVWWYLRPTVRLLQAGDSFTYMDHHGGSYVVGVTARDPVTGYLALQGTSLLSTGRLIKSDFYSFRAVVSQKGRYFEILRLALEDPHDDCLIVRGQQGRGFLLFPIKWVRSRPTSFGFRASCEFEGSFRMIGTITPGDWKTVSVPAGNFTSRYITLSVGFGFASNEVGSGEMWISPELGFPVLLVLVSEGRPQKLSLTAYTLASASR